MPIVVNQGYSINYEITCPSSGPTLMLVAGLGEQIDSVEFPREQCELFAAHGFQVVRMDNRESGLSQPAGDNESSSGEFTLKEMASDVIAVAKDLNVDKIHIVGASMGGFIVRWVALMYPECVSSLAVVMSGSGAGADDAGPQIKEAAIQNLIEMTVRRGQPDAINHAIENWRWLWGSKYPFDEDWIRSVVTSSFHRSYRPEGIESIFGIIAATPSLWDEQIKISCPTLVLHGGEDECFESEHGEAIASRIPNAILWHDPKMGHIMHKEQWLEFAKRIATMAGLIEE